MEVSGVKQQVNVNVIKQQESQLEKVTGTVLDGLKESMDKSRDFHSTGHNLNVTA